MLAYDTRQPDGQLHSDQRHRHSGIPTFRQNGLEKGYDHPAYAPLVSTMVSLPFTTNGARFLGSIRSCEPLNFGPTPQIQIPGTALVLTAGPVPLSHNTTQLHYCSLC